MAGAAKVQTMKTRSLLATIAVATLALAVLLQVGTPAQASAASAPARWVGFYVPGAPLSLTPLSALEAQIGSGAKVSNYFQNTSQGFTATQAGSAVAHGATPLITLEFWNPANGVNQPSFSLKSISGGAFDTYLHQYARDAKAFGSEVWLRPLHEMNGNWYPWGGAVNGNSPTDFAPAWRHIHDIFAAEGATNVKFVWSPNADSVPGGSANAISAYWPGDAYVDYLALDGYNFGSGTGSTWRTFGEVFGSGYAAVTAMSAKPLFIAETACSPVGGNKAAWIADMFASIPARYPRIVGTTWFNANKEHDWRVESSPESLAAFAAGLSAPAPVTPPSTIMPVYRFYNLRTGSHFYTASSVERLMVNATWPTVFADEGVAFSVNTANAANNQPLWRFYNVRTGSHFYTASDAERAMVNATWPSIFVDEGRAYDVSTTPVPGATAVYRFYNTSNGTHFYTASIAERDSVRANLGAIYHFEGPVFYLAN